MSPGCEWGDTASSQGSIKQTRSNGGTEDWQGGSQSHTEGELGPSGWHLSRYVKAGVRERALQRGLPRQDRKTSLSKGQCGSP